MKVSHIKFLLIMLSLLSVAPRIAAQEYTVETFVTGVTAPVTPLQYGDLITALNNIKEYTPANLATTQDDVWPTNKTMLAIVSSPIFDATYQGAYGGDAIFTAIQGFFNARETQKTSDANYLSNLRWLLERAREKPFLTVDQQAWVTTNLNTVSSEILAGITLITVQPTESKIIMAQPQESQIIPVQPQEVQVTTVQSTGTTETPIPRTDTSTTFLRKTPEQVFIESVNAISVNSAGLVSLLAIVNNTAYNSPNYLGSKGGDNLFNKIKAFYNAKGTFSASWDIVNLMDKARILACLSSTQKSTLNTYRITLLSDRFKAALNGVTAYNVTGLNSLYSIVNNSQYNTTELRGTRGGDLLYAKVKGFYDNRKNFSKPRTTLKALLGKAVNLNCLTPIPQRSNIAFWIPFAGL